MDDYLSKPLALSEIEAMLAKWLKAEKTEKLSGRENRYRQGSSAKGQQDQPRPVLDLSALEMIRALQHEGVPDLLERLIEAYIETAPALLEQIGQGIVKGDGKLLCRSANSLKSSSGNLGARALATLCEDLELTLKDNSDPDEELLTLFDRLKAEFGQVQRILLEELA